MNRCKACEHWAGDEVSWMPLGSRPCGVIHPRADHGLAALDNPSFASEDAVLYTAPDFGCALWSAKSPQDGDDAPGDSKDDEGGP